MSDFYLTDTFTELQHLAKFADDLKEPGCKQLYLRAIDNLERVAASEIGQIEELTSENARVEDELCEQETEIENLKRDNDRLEDEIGDLENDLRKAKAKIEELELLPKINQTI